MSCMGKWTGRIMGWAPSAILAFTAVCAEAEWLTFHGDYALRGRASAELPERLERVWRIDTGLPIDYTPVACGDRIYAVAGDDLVICLDRDGRELWRTSLTWDLSGRRRSGIAASPVLAEGILLIASHHGAVKALDADTGRERWRADLGSAVMSAPNWSVDRDGVGRFVVVASSKGVVHALDASTGETAWRSPKLDRCDSPPSCAAGLVVVGSCAAALHILDARRGEELRRVALGPDSQVAGGTALDGGLAFSGNRGGVLVCADLESGDVLWRTETLPAEVFAAPAVAGDRIVFAAEDGTVAAADRENGVLLWTRKLPRGPVTVSIAGQQVVASADGALHLLRLSDGAETWSVRVSDRISGPAAVRGLLIVGTDEGAFIAFGMP